MHLFLFVFGVVITFYLIVEFLFLIFNHILAFLPEVWRLLTNIHLIRLMRYHIILYFYLYLRILWRYILFNTALCKVLHANHVFLWNFFHFLILMLLKSILFFNHFKRHLPLQSQMSLEALLDFNRILEFIFILGAAWFIIFFLFFVLIFIN